MKEYTIIVAVDYEEDTPSAVLIRHAYDGHSRGAIKKVRHQLLEDGYHGHSLHPTDIRVVACYEGTPVNLHTGMR